MPPDRAREIKDLFLEARELTVAAREQFLAEISDLEVRAELARLLRADLGAADVLDEDPFGALLPEPLQLQPGDLVAERYRIQSLLAEGGFGSVYLANDERAFGRKVVLKFPAAADAMEWREERLEQEARTLARLHHPGVVGLLEAGVSAEHGRFLVMEFIPGLTLREELSRGRPDRERAWRILRQVASAVAAAHEAGIIHLDLKPENIVLQNPGQTDEQAVVLDFGLAFLLAPDDDTLARELVGGSLDYMAPERAEGEASTASDVFSLGVVAYELFTGQLPPEQLLNPTPVLGRFWFARGPLPPRILKALRRALSRDPRQRFATARDFLNAIGRPRRRTARYLWPAAAMVIASGVLLAPQMVRRPPAEELFVIKPFSGQAGRELSPSFSADGKLIYYVWIKRAETAGDIYAREFDTRNVRQLTNSPEAESSPEPSRDGKWLAFVRRFPEAGAALMVMPAEGGTERTVFRGGIHSFTWFPDGGSILVSVRQPEAGGQLRLRRVDVRTGAVSNYVDLPEGLTGDIEPAFSNGGERLVFSRFESYGKADLWLVQLDSKQAPRAPPQRLTDLRLETNCPRWSPDGKSIFFVAGPTRRKAVWRLWLEGKREPHRVTGVGDLRYFTSARSRELLAITLGRSDSNIWQYDLAGPGGPVVGARAILDGAAEEDEPRFSPDGKALSFSARLSGEEQVWISRADGSERTRVSSAVNADNIYSLWNPRTSELGVIWQIAEGGFAARWLAPPSYDWAKSRGGTAEPPVALSRDGEWLYFRRQLNDEPRLFKRHLGDGTTVQAATAPAFWCMESTDGATLYYVGLDEARGVWRTPSRGGGPEEQFTGPLVRRRGFVVGRTGLYYITPGIPGSVYAFLRYKPFSAAPSAKEDGRILARLEKPPSFGMDVSADEKRLLIPRLDIHDINLYTLEPVGRTRQATQ